MERNLVNKNSKLATLRQRIFVHKVSFDKQSGSKISAKENKSDTDIHKGSLPRLFMDMAISPHLHLRFRRLEGRR